ncbi:MAG: 4Fe-4S binding protein [Prevotellaceae bacterium]|nr:4Fe-4S binding protein [Prevotellaceae bacterium]
MFWNKRSLIADVIEDKCNNCSCCVQICRRCALVTCEVVGKVVTFVNDPRQCTGCGECVDICPNKAIELVDRYC